MTRRCMRTEATLYLLNTRNNNRNKKRFVLFSTQSMIILNTKQIQSVKYRCRGPLGTRSGLHDEAGGVYRYARAFQAKYWHKLRLFILKTEWLQKCGPLLEHTDSYQVEEAFDVVTSGIAAATGADLRTSQHTATGLVYSFLIHTGPRCNYTDIYTYMNIEKMLTCAVSDH